MCRTIVVGKEKELVDCFLILISYFIRCSQVHLRKQNEEIIFEFGDSSLHFTSEEGQSFVSTNPVDTTTLQVIELEFPPIGNQPLDEQQSLCRSLFASYCDRYCSDFVLMGLKPSYDLVPLIAQDLKAWVNHPPLRPELALGHTACIVIDTDNNLCEIYTYDPQNEIPIDWKGGSVEGIWCYKMSSIPAIDSMLNTLDSLWSSHSFPPEAVRMS